MGQSSALVEGFLRDYQFTEKEIQTEETWILDFLDDHRVSLFPSKTIETKPFPFNRLCIVRLGSQNRERSDWCWVIRARVVIDQQ